MSAPPEFIRRFSEALAKATIPLIHEVWDRCERETREKIANSLIQGPPGSAVEAARAATQFPRPPQSAAEAAAQAALSLTLSPQKRGAQNRERKGVVKNAIREIIYERPTGISRTGIREVALRTKGLTIKDGSLKQGLRLLSRAKEIENKDRLWFPTKNGGQPGG